MMAEEQGDFCISIPAAGGYEQLVRESLTSSGTSHSIGAQSRLFEIPAEQHVTVAVSAAGVNYADIVIRFGMYSSAKEYVGWPITPGFEFSGTITEVGSDCGDFKVGDEVFGVSLFGAYTTNLRVPARFIFRKPSFLTTQQAAGFPCVSLTAYYAIFELVHPRPGSSVLIHSAAGGVGSMLVQICKIAECHVVGVVGASHKVKAAQELGCDAVIDKSTESLWDRCKELQPKGFKAIFDANGNTIMDSYKHLMPSGKLVVYGFHSYFPREGGQLSVFAKLRLGYTALTAPTFSPLEMVSSNKSVLAFNLSYLFSETTLFTESMTTMMNWLEDGKLRMPAVQGIPLAEVAESHRRLESGQTIGKLVLLTPKELAASEGVEKELVSATDVPEGEKPADGDNDHVVPKAPSSS